MGFFGVFYLDQSKPLGMFIKYQKQILKVLHVPETQTSHKIRKPIRDITYVVGVVSFP